MKLLTTGDDLRSDADLLRIVLKDHQEVFNKTVDKGFPMFYNTLYFQKVLMRTAIKTKIEKQLDYEITGI